MNPRIRYEPSHELMALFVLCKLILQTRIRSHPVGPSLVAYVISTIISWAGSYNFLDLITCSTVCTSISIPIKHFIPQMYLDESFLRWNLKSFKLQFTIYIHTKTFVHGLRVSPELSEKHMLCLLIRRLGKIYYMSRLLTKPTKWHVCPAKTQISLGIRPVWSESSLSAWRKLESLATHWAHSEDSDQTGRMPRLIWVFAGRNYHFVGFVVRRLLITNSNYRRQRKRKIHNGGCTDKCSRSPELRPTDVHIDSSSLWRQ